MRLPLIALTVLALAACQGKQEATNQSAAANVASAANATTGNVAQTVANLTQPEKEAVFFRAIRDAGLNCQTVVKAEPVDPMQGRPTWRAQCEDGAYHLISISPDGSAQVTSRTTP